MSCVLLAWLPHRLAIVFLAIHLVRLRCLSLRIEVSLCLYLPFQNYFSFIIQEVDACDGETLRLYRVTSHMKTSYPQSANVCSSPLTVSVLKCLTFKSYTIIFQFSVLNVSLQKICS